MLARSRLARVKVWYSVEEVMRPGVGVRWNSTVQPEAACAAPNRTDRWRRRRRGGRERKNIPFWFFFLIFQENQEGEKLDHSKFDFSKTKCEGKIFPSPAGGSKKNSVNFLR
jgi:hypothetical protein